MHKPPDTRLICTLVAAALVIMIFLIYRNQAGRTRVSQFGKYEGYSSAIYDGTRRISD
jgi:hypothetical protein